MFKPPTTPHDFPASELEILKYWEENEIYHRSLEQRRGGKPFIFYEGPPTANGLPHPGHCLTRAMKDLFPRYRTMCGSYCERRAGWDTHGLPVEVEVCKELGIHSKDEIESYGVEPFIHRCIESVFRYTKEWEELTKRLGFWVDLDRAYVTYHQSYVESVWWALKSLFDAGLLYQGNKIVWWWAQGGTALSSGEVGQGYREVDDPSVFVRFPLVEHEGTSLLVWTTTPWTLLSNTFAAVHPELDYALVEVAPVSPADGKFVERLYIARDLVETVAKKANRELRVVDTCKGTELIGLRYRPPFDIYAKEQYQTRAELKVGGDDSVAWRVLAAAFVTIDSGTGLVHEAPAFGEVDYELMMLERERFVDPEAVPLLNAVEPNGTFSAMVGDKYAGRWVKEADKDICRDLRERGLLFHQELYRHDYPFCWRADQDPLIQYPRRSWFVKTTKFVDQMLANNDSMYWLPDHIKKGRFGKFLESNVDWALSRERYWGTPLPIYVCEETGRMEAIASYAELLAKNDVQGTEVWAEAKRLKPDLSEHLKVHKPYIDAISYASPFADGARMRRVSEVIDCWFDSGAMPFAQLGYPHQNRELLAKNFPADFISEALDQTRGWFYSLLAISTLLFGPEGVARRDGDLADGVASEWPMPFRSCIVLGLIGGEDGLKMSKSKRNYSTPDEVFAKEGADAMRWLFFSGQAPWTSIRFSTRAMEEGKREFLLRLYNVYSFFVIYARIDGYMPDGSDVRGTLPAALSELDQWILGELNATVRDVREAMDRYDNFPAARRLSEFVDALSNWYVRRSRDRFWKSGMGDDKRAAYGTLYHCLVTTTQLAAPFVPFFTETLHQNLVGSRREAGVDLPESVHLCDYPEVDEARLDERLQSAMAVAREIASLGRAARAGANFKVRQPLQEVEIVLADSRHHSWLKEHSDLIRDELNVKTVGFLLEADEYCTFAVKPDFRALGPKFGKQVPAIKQALGAVVDPAAMRRELDARGSVSVTLNDGETVELAATDVQVELTAKAGWIAAQGKSAVVVLKTDLTAELEREGLARELVHHIQQVRKRLDLAYEQRIDLGVAGDEMITGVATEFADYLKGETLADTLMTKGTLDGSTASDANVEGHAVTIHVKPVERG